MGNAHRDKDNSESTGIKEKRIKCDYKNIRGNKKSRKGSEKDFSTHFIIFVFIIHGLQPCRANEVTSST